MIVMRFEGIVVCILTVVFNLFVVMTGIGKKSGILTFISHKVTSTECETLTV